VNILVKKDNQTFGPHSREEILEFIESGELNENDLATPDGEENWDSLGKLLTHANQENLDSSIYDQFEDDEVDYEKLKEWEDVFVDEDVEDEEFEESPSPEANDTDIDQGIPLPTDEPPSTESPFPVEEVNPPPVEPVPPLEEAYFHQEQVLTEPEPEPEQSYSPPPSLPLPPPPLPSKMAKEKPPVKAVKDRISASHNIKGLNSKQTVIVVKGSGILSKIYSTSLVFIILFVLSVIVGFAGLIFAPDRVAPIFLKMGVPASLIDTFSPPNESSQK
jgi:hypothetical protein